jgi:hypothetical protein
MNQPVIAVTDPAKSYGNDTALAGISRPHLPRVIRGSTRVPGIGLAVSTLHSRVSTSPSRVSAVPSHGS